MVGRLDLSESRSAHAMSAMQCTDWPGGDGRERKERQRPLCSGAAGAFLCPCSSACTLECKQPFHVASSCLSLLALGRRVPKITGRVLPLVGHSPASGQACSLPAVGGAACGPRPLLRLPVATPSPASLRCYHIPLYCSSQSEPRRLGSPLWA